MSKRLFASVSNYSLGSLLFSLAGLISFPLLTRLLSVEDYGLLALVGATLTFIVALAKAGLQHSTLRFYSETLEGGKSWTLNNYYSTVLYGMGTIGLVVTILWLITSQLVPENYWNSPRLNELFAISAILIVIRTLDSVLVNFLRAKEFTGIYNIYRVVKRYATLALILITLFFITRDLSGFFISTIIVELFVLLALAYYLFRHKLPLPNEFSFSLFRVMLIFGVPMIGYELAGIMLSMGDRYIIQWYMGSAALGPYAAGYNLVEMVHGIVIAAFGQAVMPMYLRIWSEHGESETRIFIEQSIYYYMLISLPIVAGLSAVGPELLTVLASSKYSDGIVIIPYVIAGLALDGAIVLVGAGLYIHKQSMMLMVLVAISASINILLNILLVPDIGLEGAAIATLLSYLFLTYFIYAISSRKLNLTIPWYKAAKLAVISYLMYFVVIHVEMENIFTTIVAQMVVGVVVYVVMVLLFDSRARDTLKEVYNKFQRN